MSFVLDLPHYKKSHYCDVTDNTIGSLKSCAKALLPTGENNDGISFFSLYNGRKMPLTTDEVSLMLNTNLFINPHQGICSNGKISHNVSHSNDCCGRKQTAHIELIGGYN